jgi:hypothetical protein
LLLHRLLIRNHLGMHEREGDDFRVVVRAGYLFSLLKPFAPTR